MTPSLFPSLLSSEYMGKRDITKASESEFKPTDLYRYVA